MTTDPRWDTAVMHMATLRNTVMALTAELERERAKASAWWAQLTEAGIEPADLDPHNGPTYPPPKRDGLGPTTWVTHVAETPEAGT